MKKAVSVNVGNDFYQKGMDELVRLLEEGEKVWIYVPCIGHTRTAMVQSEYLSKLKEKYGDRLKEGKEDGWLDCYYLD